MIFLNFQFDTKNVTFKKWGLFLPNSGLYSIWQACTLIWTGYLSELFVGTKLPQIVI